MGFKGVVSSCLKKDKNTFTSIDGGHSYGSGSHVPQEHVLLC